MTTDATQTVHIEHLTCSQLPPQSQETLLNSCHNMYGLPGPRSAVYLYM